MSKVIFARGSYERKPEFQLVTMLKKAEQGLSASKRMAHPDAAAHLASFATKRKMLVEAGVNCDVAKISDSNKNEVTFEFIQGNSLESQFYEALRADDIAKIAAIFNRVFAIVDALPSQNLNPSQNQKFRNFFGHYYDKAVDCVTPACIDFNLDNFIEGSGRLTLIDYEWVFDFPVPKDFIKLRALHQTFWGARLLALKLKPDAPVIAFGKQFFLPEAVYDIYKKLCSQDNVLNYLKTNSYFINSLILRQFKFNASAKKLKAGAGDFLEQSSPFSIGQPKIIKELAEQAETIQQQQTAITKKQERIDQLEHTLTYKLLQRAEIRTREKFTK